MEGNLLRLIFHIIAFSIYAYTVAYSAVYITLPMHKQYGGRFKYLTYWNKYIHTIFFGLSIVNDIFICGRPTLKSVQRGGLQRFMDIFFSGIVFPVGMFVQVMFWALFLINRDLIYPASLDKIIPPFINHSDHTLIALFLLLELCIVYHHYPLRRTGITTLFLFMVTYLLWILWIAYYADEWVYPILKVLNAAQRVIFILLAAMSVVPLYLLGELLNYLVWKPESPVAMKKKVK